MFTYTQWRNLDGGRWSLIPRPKRSIVLTHKCRRIIVDELNYVFLSISTKKSWRLFFLLAYLRFFKEAFQRFYFYFSFFFFVFGVILLFSPDVNIFWSTLPIYCVVYLNLKCNISFFNIKYNIELSILHVLKYIMIDGKRFH